MKKIYEFCILSEREELKALSAIIKTYIKNLIDNSMNNSLKKKFNK